MVKARDIQGGNNTIVSVIGDGSLTNGMIYEALNNCADKELRLLIVVNDTVLLTQRGKFLRPSRNELVRITLVPHVEEKLILGRIENPM